MAKPVGRPRMCALRENQERRTPVQDTSEVDHVGWTARSIDYGAGAGPVNAEAI